MTTLDHLERATVQSRMLCTHDQDFLRLAAAGTEHAGIAFSSQTRVSIGG
jgi:predicted nuclease of predicted toxin-antitoxin system